jgi:transcriptional regulator with XRE-family HTH domain
MSDNDSCMPTMSPTPKQIGRRLKTLRIAREMSRAELAGRSGLSGEYLRKLEAGAQSPTVSTLQKVARVLGVKASTVLE